MKTLNISELTVELNKLDKVSAHVNTELNKLVVKNDTEYTALVSHKFILHNTADLVKHSGDEVRGVTVLSFYDILN